jgi:hypothetical protein
MYLPLTTSLVFFQPPKKRILVRGATIHVAADAALFRRLCGFHLNCGGGEAPMALHASRIHSVMVLAVHACGVSSRVTAQKVAGSGPMSSYLQ